MANVPRIIGQNAVLANMKKASAALSIRHSQGLKMAGLVLQGASQKKTPVETGAMRASATTRERGTGLNSSVQVGYTANYALWVHEAKMVLKGKNRPAPAKGKFWDPQGRATNQFLLKAAQEEKPRMIRIYKSIAGRGI